MEKQKNKSKTDYFVKAFNSLLRNPEYKATEIRLFLLLVSYGGKNKNAYPSHNTLAKDMGLSKRMVINILNDLQKLGAIYVIKQKKESGRDTSNYYALADIDEKTGKFIESSSIKSAKIINTIYEKVVVKGK